ncbi:MAG: hypothetical protein L6R41_001585 [Letrouitia leprolyta]|nr:MAG: hypothetical protein L6R41_001585 [Letrouitia leprolyta]
MSTSREGPNPLRPYYVPPSVGNPPKIATTANIGSRNGSSPTTSPSFGSSARNILAEMDYSEYLSDTSPSSTATIKTIAEQAIWKYSSVFLAQPFEVAKTVLQVRAPSSGQKGSFQGSAADSARMKRMQYRTDDIYRDYEDSSDSDYDSPSYFTANAPLRNTLTRQPRARRRQGSLDLDQNLDAAPSHVPPSKTSAHTLDLKSPSSLTAAVSILWQTEGAWGVWKGTNSTYFHSVLLSTLTSFIRSFLAAIFAIPDPSLSFQLNPSAGSAGGLDILSSPNPLSSLAVAVSAASVAGIVLAPLDIARTKLMLTPSTHPPRSIMSTLNSLSSWTLPWAIAPVTFLHSTLPTLLSTSLPLFLRSKLNIDPLLTPNVYAVATFIGQGLELGIKLPLETVLRRGQIHIAQSTAEGQEMQTVVEAGPYKGLIGTIRSVVYEEGERSPKPIATSTNAAARTGRPVRESQPRKGQGLEGLFRGWRVGMWGLIGVWGAATIGGAGSKGGEF